MIESISKSPAKVNLRLKVRGKRSDGYHELSMLNVRVDLYDDVRIVIDSKHDSTSVKVKTTSETISLAGLDLDSPESNLASRAVELVYDQLGRRYHTSIEIIKNIPIGGGLGGGSSNAATVLLKLPELLLDLGLIEVSEKSDLDNSLFLESAKLGADVPYFMAASSPFMHVSGIGEIIKPLGFKLVEPVALLLIFPEISLSTKAVFSNFSIEEHSSQIEHATESLEPKDSETLTDYFRRIIDNDLLLAAIKEDPKIKEFHDRLSRVPQIISAMSGSGSTFFSIFPGSDLQQHSQLLKEALKSLPYRLQMAEILL